MLTIRAEQAALLIAAGERHTEARAMCHLKSCIAESCATMTEEDLLEIVRWGRRRSRRYGIEREYDFFRYLNLMFMFGLDFDTSPQCPWAARTLTGKGRASARMDLLMDHAMLACSRMERNRTY